MVTEAQTTPNVHLPAVRPSPLVKQVTEAPPERFGWLFTKQDYYRNPDMLPNLDALQSNINMTKELGFVKAPLDVKKYTDLSLAKEAAARLK